MVGNRGADVRRRQKFSQQLKRMAASMIGMRFRPAMWTACALGAGAVGAASQAVQSQPARPASSTSAPPQPGPTCPPRTSSRPSATRRSAAGGCDHTIPREFPAIRDRIIRSSFEQRFRIVVRDEPRPPPTGQCRRRPPNSPTQLALQPAAGTVLNLSVTPEEERSRTRASAAARASPAEFAANRLDPGPFDSGESGPRPSRRGRHRGD